MGRALRLAVATVSLGAGGVLWLLGLAGPADAVWATSTALALAVSAATVARDVVRGRLGVDVVALLALAGSLAVAEYLAGAVIALMLATGLALEAAASARARRELEALVSRAPVTAHRLDGGAATAVSVEDIVAGDLLLVAAGEVLPVDGAVYNRGAMLDESALTGESQLVECSAGDPVRSGSLNAGGAFVMRATATAAASTYAGIVRLVREAESSRAPFVRLADRYALWFIPATLVAAAVAGAVAHDLVRAVAVLVVATPCPLILAAPVAIVGGMSRAARRGIIVKNGAALEALGRADTVLFDKTGTLTAGSARLLRVETGTAEPSAEEVLRVAASVDQASTHAIAQALAAAAHDRDLAVELAGDVVEDAGRGVTGTVGGRRVDVGRATYVAGADSLPEWAERARRRAARQGLADVVVAIDGQVRGVLVLDDPIRVDAARTVSRLRATGVKRVAMVTGDHDVVARGVARGVGLDAVYAEATPEQKLAAVRQERSRGTVVMVGDGINDAPALAAADVGVAMGARGATASSQAADVVLMVDRIDRLVEARRLARRSRQIALQSVVAGMSLSFVAMGAAAFGLLVPVVGAVVQEGIDVAVIINALRAHGIRGPVRPPLTAVSAGRRVLDEHRALNAGTERLLAVADELGRVPAAAARRDLVDVARFLRDQLLPHERAEEQSVFPVVAPWAGGEEGLVAGHREHAEVARRAELIVEMVEGLGPAGPDEDESSALRSLLYGLHAVLRMHRSGEEERLAGVLDDSAPVSAGR